MGDCWPRKSEEQWPRLNGFNANLTKSADK